VSNQKGRVMTISNGYKVSTELLERAKIVAPNITKWNEVERLNAVDIAARLKISAKSVHRYCKVLGIKLHHLKPWSIIDKSKWNVKIPPLINKGMQYKDIAILLGSNQSVVYNWCLRNNLDRKTIYKYWHGRHKKQNNTTINIS